MKLLIDMNLSPEWVAVLQRHGFQSVHWSTVGNPRAPDAEILAWARATGHLVFTHDLGFGALLAATDALGPSVAQVRTQDVTPGHLESVVVTALRAHAVRVTMLSDGDAFTLFEGRGDVEGSFPVSVSRRA